MFPEDWTLGEVILIGTAFVLSALGLWVVFMLLDEVLRAVRDKER